MPMALTLFRVSPVIRNDLHRQRQGFPEIQRRKIVLGVAEKARVDVQLTVGSVTEVVEVTGESVAQSKLSLRTSRVTITGKQIDNLGA